MAKVFWFTGLSGAGKTTIAQAAAAALRAEGYRVALLDGDNVRERLHRHLGFSNEDILENNRLIAGLCLDSLPDNDAIFVPVISPFEAGRREARERIGDAFRLVHFSAPLGFVEKADVKGLYGRARSGELDNLIGVAEENPYQAPADADFEIDISRHSETACIDRFVSYVRREIRD